MSIPKIAHYTWVSKDILHSENPLILNGLRNFVAMNPDWTVTVSEDQDVNRDLRQYMTAQDYQLLDDRHFVERCDLWRLCQIYHHGGLYIDIDRFYNIPMNQVIDSDKIKFLLPTNGDYDFSQDIMCSAPLNPIIKDTIELNLARRRQGHRHTYLLGAQTYMHCITMKLFDQMINTNPGAQCFEQIRSEISKFDFIKTHREVLPNDTMVYKYDPQTYQAGNGLSKTDLYTEFGITHWMSS